jgi:hypothetical protein
VLINTLFPVPPHPRTVKPLRLTVLGCGGTGKSVLINTLVGCIRSVFQDNNSVFVTAAYNVGGSTIHKEFKIGIQDIASHENMSHNQKEELMKKLLNTIVLFFDEQSIISQLVIGRAEKNVCKTAHGGGHEPEDWGGIPVVIAFGDDYQLPTPGQLGAINSLSNPGKSKVSQSGANQYINLGSRTMELTTIMRQDEEQKEFRELLKDTRLGHPTEQEKDIILSLHLNSGNFTQSQIEEIKAKKQHTYMQSKGK